MESLLVVPMTVDRARELASWRYPAPYDCYDFPEWGQMEVQGWAITRPERHAEFRALYREGRLAGWYWLRRQDNRVVFSCGLRPDQCGHGIGRDLMAIALGHCANDFPGEVIELTVRPFNERARRAYARAGFQRVANASAEGYIVMRRLPAL